MSAMNASGPLHPLPEHAELSVPAPAANGGASLAVDRRLAFCLAGRAIFTLRNSATGNRFTYRIRSRRRHGYFVSVLRGAENESDSSYSQIGTIHLGGSPARPYFVPVVRVDLPQSIRVFLWAWPRIVAGTLPEEIEFFHAGRCAKCGRRLTTPESIASGIGPKCAERGQ